MVEFFVFRGMNKLLWLCGIIAFAVISCTEGNRGSGKEKDALSAYDSVLIGRDPGYSCGRTEVYWMLYKNGSVTKCTRSIFVSDDGKDTVRTVRFSDDSAHRVQELVDDMDTGKVYNFGDKPGPWSTKLYETLRGIQYGTIEDKHGWTTVVIE